MTESTNKASENLITRSPLARHTAELKQIINDLSKKNHNIVVISAL